MNWLDKKGRAIKLGDIVKRRYSSDGNYSKNEWVVWALRKDGDISIGSTSDNGEIVDYWTVDPHGVEITQQANHRPIPLFQFGDKVTSLYDGSHYVVVKTYENVVWAASETNNIDIVKFFQDSLLEGWVEIPPTELQVSAKEPQEEN